MTLTIDTAFAAAFTLLAAGAITFSDATAFAVGIAARRVGRRARRCPRLVELRFASSTATVASQPAVAVAAALNW